ncbi:hypothetical protein [uncultured Tolumonas sp.]|uniref:hypothetical protein n=1 Tax=uncultured Tolumonas sp. TaxID=263765 RepID=UPI002931B156|nr:hypothetical protein [uncultured Tolumonas sp.]
MEFFKNAKEYARNPLGIIALFISLIYGFASLLLGSSADKLESSERWPLLIFIVSFPFTVLLVFYKLVTEHHGKLYSPSDYKTDDSFLKTLSAEEKEKKLEEDAMEAAGNVFIENLTSEDNFSVNLVKNKIKKYEDYVINLLSKELNIAPNIGVQISQEYYTFDASYITPGVGATILEIKYYSQPRIMMKTIQEFMYRAKLTNEYMKIKTNFIVVLILDGDKDKFKLITDTWSYSLKETSIDIELRVLYSAEINV